MVDSSTTGTAVAANGTANPQAILTTPLMTMEDEERVDFLPNKKRISHNFHSPVKLTSSAPSASTVSNPPSFPASESSSTLEGLDQKTTELDVEKSKKIIEDTEDLELESFRKDALWRQFCALRTQHAEKLEQLATLESNFLALKETTKSFVPFMELVKEEIQWCLGKEKNGDKNTMQIENLDLYELINVYISKLHTLILEGRSFDAAPASNILSEQDRYKWAESAAALIRMTSKAEITQETLNLKTLMIEELENKIQSCEKKIQKLKMNQHAFPVGSEQLAAAITKDIPESLESIVCNKGSEDDKLKMKDLENKVALLQSNLQVLESQEKQRLEEIEIFVKSQIALEQELSQIRTRFLGVPPNFKSYLDYYDQNGRLHEQIHHLKRELDTALRQVDVAYLKQQEFVQEQHHKEVFLRKELEHKIYSLNENYRLLLRESEQIRENELSATGKAEEMTKMNRAITQEMEQLQKVFQGLRKDFKKENGSLLEEDALLMEIETIAEAFEKVQERNTALTKQLLVKEEIFNKLLQEKRALENERKSLGELEATERESAQIIKSSLKLYIEKLEANELSCKERLITSEKDLAKYKMDVEYYRRKHYEVAQVQQTELVATLNETQEKYVALQKEVNDLKESLGILKHERSRLQEDLIRASKKLEHYSSIAKSAAGNSGAYVSDIESQLGMYKSLIQCQTCQKELKDTVLTKCMHVFCRACLDIRVESRQRKCPNCNEPFSQSEMRTIYL